jgi:HTH-type transcriptional regulator / antitoxin HipB
MGSKREQVAAKPETPTQALGRLVRQQRKLMGLSQEALAEHAQVGLAFLYELEHGKPTVRFDKVLAVLEVLGVTLTLTLARPDRRPGTIWGELPEPSR